ncbi:MAG: DNA helicase, partial [Rhizobiales bacterium]|nr:DNA helicase [Hyphomicrobiales bacterium]
VVDHLGLVKSTTQKPRTIELGDITDELATIAKDFNIAVVVLCQLNRSLESRDNKRPELHDLRNSGEIEENAACVLGLYRPAYYLEKTKHDDMAKELDRKEQLKKIENDYEVHVLKQRNGPLGEVKLSCHMPTNSIGNKGRY